MTEQEVPSSVAQRIIIKFLTNEGVKPSEILTRLRAQFGDSTLSQNRVFTWAREFKGGRERVENESHDRRPTTSLTDDNIRAVRELIERDRRLTVEEISTEVGISYGSVQSIITDQLGFRKISARWVPKPKTGRQKRWKASGSISARKGKSLHPRVKNGKGILLVDFLHDQRTVNAAYYCQLLRSAKAVYRNKRRDMPIRDVILVHDNARPHTAALTSGTLKELSWKTLEHPPYSPDLSP
ncbi:histone-lysine N-methyltransferase SETMAR-like [Rhodnius prolixus]|uniref:histone-lysine N-methyltransferase SETMAR-like n=1 Tax=Rhodnius prolixus TaxID=13249 RepID=UPI003D18BE36